VRRTDCKIPESDYVFGYRRSYGWKKRNIRVRSWIMELKEELYNTGLAFVWTKQRECDLTEITKIVKDRCNNIERQNILTKLEKKSSLTLYREMNFFWGGGGGKKL